MKISLFKDWNICTWIDYSKKEDCIWVFDLSNTDIKKIENWCKLSSVWDIIETDKYLEYLKQEKLNEYKLIEKEAVEKRWLYLTAELLPEWDFRTNKLSRLDDDRKVIEAKFNAKISELVDLYWEEILDTL